MSGNICICLKSHAMKESHKAKIRKTAEETGFTPHFFTMDEMDAATACLQECAILFAHAPGLLRPAPATLKWYCCASAGVDPYCKNDGIFANPDCILTNSNVYGVTIAEHVIMAFLMMLRRMPEYIDIVHDRKWENQLPIRSIRDNRFTILGTGNIGQEVAARLRGMGAASIVGVSRSGKPVEGVFDEVYPNAENSANDLFQGGGLGYENQFQFAVNYGYIVEEVDENGVGTGKLVQDASSLIP